MGRLTTHVLDTANGRPAAGVRVELRAIDGLVGSETLVTTTTNADGRTDQPLLAGEDFKPGRYELPTWRWSREPSDFPAANAKVLETALEVFGTTYGEGVQDSLYRMGEAVLKAVPEVAEISMACANKHYLRIDLSKF